MGMNITNPPADDNPVLIESGTTASSQSSIDITGIGTSYKKLIFRFYGKGSTDVASVWTLRLDNQSGGTDYSWHYVVNDDSSTGDTSDSEIELYDSPAHDSFIQIEIPITSKDGLTGCVGVIWHGYMYGANIQGGGSCTLTASQVSRLTFAVSAGNLVDNSEYELWGIT
jgi:hypothetical protein